MKTLYPTEQELDTIRKWPINDFKNMMKFISMIWIYSPHDFMLNNGKHYIYTGGFKENEKIIDAMRDNIELWLERLISSDDKGNYVFKA